MWEDMKDEDQREMANLRNMLYRAVRELSYIHEFSHLAEKEHRHLIESCEGQDIVDQGMKLLGCADLAPEELPMRLVRA